jgi:Coenzyme PQQ synthesis protein D (PqqD)
MPNEMPEQFFTRSTSVVARVVGGETLIVPIRGKVGDLASIYSFNGTGTLIWQLLESPRTAEELSAGVAREYAVEHEQARKDVAQFVGEMLSVGLVEICQAPAMIAESQKQAEWQSATR